MSILLDALKHARSSDAKTEASPQKDASEAREVAGIRIPTLSYALAAVVLLVAGTIWIFYPRHQSAPALRAEPVAVTLPATHAASSVTQTTALSATTNGSVPLPKHTWTHPPGKRKHAKQTLAREPVKPVIQALDDPLQAGYQALSLDNLDLAKQKYQTALALHPHEKDALLGLAVIAQRRMQTAQAAELYRQVLREDLGNATAAAGLVSLSAQADPVSAESQLKELLDLKPDAPELHYALGDALARQQRWGEAQQSFFRAHSLAPANALYAFNLAVSLDHLRQSGTAINYYRQAIGLAKPGDSTLDADAIRRRIQELGEE